jgi:hypothetical protein
MTENAAKPNLESPSSTLSKLIGGFRVSQMISVAAKLRIADHLEGRVKTLAELARAVECPEDSLYRLLRALANQGIFREEDGPAFGLTPLAELLRSDTPRSMRITAEVAGEDWMWRPWGSLFHSVTTGETAFNHEYGKNTWDWFGENPAAGRLFDAYMDEITTRDASVLVAAYPFERARTIVDIGGGRGVLLAEILRQNSSARGILFNLPSVIETASKTLLDTGVAGRIGLVQGSFFDTVPAGGDLYILKNILHDWCDGPVNAILANCRRSLNTGAKLLIIEHIVGLGDRGAAPTTGDMQMMVRTGGRNRTESELRDLLTSGGFHLSRVIQAGSGPAILEALPAV